MSGPDVSADAASVQAGLNTLLALANRLLAAVPQIRSTSHLPDPNALRESLAQGVREFESQARQAGIASERVLAARYILCTVLDEVAAATPWGGGGVWGRQSLLSIFHNETWGGEKVFQLMAKLAEDVGTNRDLLELIYACICLGFQGRFRVLDGGGAQLEAVRDRLAQMLKTNRGDYTPALAQNWRGQALSRRPLLSWLPLWTTATLMGLLLLATYLGLSYSLSGLSDPVYGAIQGLRLSPPVAAVAQPADKPRLAQFLAEEIRANQVTVRDEVDRSVVTLRGDGLFEPGSSRLSENREALMRRIAQALAQVQGPVLVTGHTDNQPIRTARFPSNWHLSQDRAVEVGRLLVSQGVAQSRVSADGRADGEPLQPNDTPANRAVNRRVEITLMPFQQEAKNARSAP